MDAQKENKILREMVETIDDLMCNFPPWWYDENFTTEEFGDEMLSQYTWWKKKKAQIGME